MTGQAAGWSTRRQLTAFVALQTVGAAGPTVAAVILSLRLSGRTGVRALSARFRPIRRHVRFYLVAAGLAPALTLVTMVVGAVVRGRALVDPGSGLAEMAADLGWLGAVLVLPAVLAGQLFSSPLLEEAGWRGFALPRLQERSGALLASLVLGLVWGLWHLPLVLVYGDALGPYLAQIVSYTVLMPVSSAWTAALVVATAALLVLGRPRPGGRAQTTDSGSSVRPVGPTSMSVPIAGQTPQS